MRDRFFLDLFWLEFEGRAIVGKTSGDFEIN